MEAAVATLDNKRETGYSITFKLNDTRYVVKYDEVTPTTTLSYYLRCVLSLKGTKKMCLEGSCGACMVVQQSTDPLTENIVFRPVNSCLVRLLSCDGWVIFTIEGILYDPTFLKIQKNLKDFNGTQCGFCSPGMVMNMYALCKSGEPKKEEVENAFGGNLCRCTGYRSILAAFKDLCSDATPGECPDIEDLVPRYEEKSEETSKEECPKKAFYMEFDQMASTWYKVNKLDDLIAFLSANYGCRMVAGNASQGIYPIDETKVKLYLDISDLKQFKVNTVDEKNCVLGAGTTLTDTIEFLNTVAAGTIPNYVYLKAVADHIALVGNRAVRNRATIAGNLITKHDHLEFVSDIFVILETIDATLTVVTLASKEKTMSPSDFIKYVSVDPIILKSVTLKPYPPEVKFVSYKIMPRAENAQAIISAAFKFNLPGSDKYDPQARIVFGNISPEFVHATETEKYLDKKNLFDNNVLKEAYGVLEKELNPSDEPPAASAEARKKLAIGLFYKAVLSLAPNVSPRNKSGGDILKRPLSHGKQDYTPIPAMYPVTKAIPKVESLAQISGELKYVMDEDSPGHLYGALVLAMKPPKSIIWEIDASKALRQEGIVAFYRKDDILGENSFTPLTSLTESEEEIFCNGTVKYYEQPVGILIGTTQEIVEDCVKWVNVKTKEESKEESKEELVLPSRQAIKHNRTDVIEEYDTILAKDKDPNKTTTIVGTFAVKEQYHFHMETQCCMAVPTETGLDVYVSTQWPDLNQVAISQMLKLYQSQVNIVVAGCGGAFGAKVTRAGLVACAASLAAWKLKKPVKLWLPLKTNMAAIGKRMPLTTQYNVTVDVDVGLIHDLKCSHYIDVGYQVVENFSSFLEEGFKNVYASNKFQVQTENVTGDRAVNTWARAPGTMEGIASIESILEHIAFATGLDPLDVRVANLPPKSPMIEFFKKIKTSVNYDNKKKEIDAFNKANRWQKKGLAVVPILFNVPVNEPFSVTVSILHTDGSVQISHGGIEVGQGINTKVIQVCAFKFGLETERFIILRSNSFASPNNFVSGGSFATDGICFAAIQACQELLDRLKVFRKPGKPWEEVVNEAYDESVSLVATGYSTEKGRKPYTVYGICATEVLVDILTGQHIVSRVDLIEDTGDALNPAVDMGQVEGAFVMGLGYYTSEKIVFDETSKRILTDNTWTYHPPGAKDIPVEFNVQFPQNEPNSAGVYGSKGTEEAAICLAISVPLAIRRAVASARNDGKKNDPWYKIDGPTNVENILLNALSDYSEFVL